MPWSGLEIHKNGVKDVATGKEAPESCDRSEVVNAK